MLCRAEAESSGDLEYTPREPPTISPGDSAAKYVTGIHLKEKVKPRMETTGLMPEIPQTNPIQHTRFTSSSSSSDGMLIRETTEENEVAQTDHCQEISTNLGQLRNYTNEASMHPSPSSGDYQQPRQSETEPEPITIDSMSNVNEHQIPMPVAHYDLPHGRRRRPRKFTGRGGPGDALPHRLHKYWLQRYSLYSRYDEGIIIDEEGWYSATPEVISWHHAKRAIAAVGPSCLAVDCFGGTGCNAIQLALAGCHVMAVELDPHKAALLQHNAQIYGVENKVEVICADFLEVAPRIKADVVFMSPPWGGPEYSHSHGDFDVENMSGHPELGLTNLLEIAFGPMGCRCAIAWLPRNSAIEQITAAAAVVPKELGGANIEIERATLNGVTKAITVYHGTAARCGNQGV